MNKIVAKIARYFVGSFLDKGSALWSRLGIVMAFEAGCSFVPKPEQNAQVYYPRKGLLNDMIK